MAGNVIDITKNYVISGELCSLMLDIANILSDYYEDREINKEKLFGLLGIFTYMVTDKRQNYINEE